MKNPKIGKNYKSKNSLAVARVVEIVGKIVKYEYCYDDERLKSYTIYEIQITKFNRKFKEI